MRLKLVLLGEGRVGKTSILLRYIRGSFTEKQQSTLQASYLEKRIAIGDGKTAQVSVWDTAGQERFHALGPIYYRDADGALLVYDITDSESFSKVRKWVKELRKIVGEDISITLAGNKSDLEKMRQVDEKEVFAFTESINANHFYTSAKTDVGLDAAFFDLSKKCVARKEASFSADGLGFGVSGGGGKGKQKKLVVIDDLGKESSSSSGCC